MTYVNFTTPGSWGKNNLFKQGWQLYLSQDRFTRTALTTLIAIIVVAPVVVLNIASHAAGSPQRLEAEAGTLSGSVSSGSDTAASGGQYVQFGQPTTGSGSVTVLPLISRGKPAFASATYAGDTPGNANDNNYSSEWRSSGAMPVWLAYDLSSVPAAQKQNVMAVWYNSSYAYSTRHGAHYNNLGTYTIEGNTAAGGGQPPTSGWVTINNVSVSGNTLHSRQHIIGNISAYNWVRINVSGIDGSTQNTDAAVTQFDLYDLSGANGVATDDWMFYGDSVTAGGMVTNSSTDSFAVLINNTFSNRFPVQENGGDPFDKSSDAVTLICGTTICPTTGSGSGYLALYPGKFVVLAYGMNDAAASGGETAFYNNMASLVQFVINNGKVPVIPKINYTNDPTHNANIPAYNAKIDLLYQNFPQIVKGPDLWTYFQNNPSLIGAGDIHPTAAGYTAMRQQWAQAMTTNVYNNPAFAFSSRTQLAKANNSTAVLGATAPSFPITSSTIKNRFGVNVEPNWRDSGNPQPDGWLCDDLNPTNPNDQGIWPGSCLNDLTNQPNSIDSSINPPPSPNFTNPYQNSGVTSMIDREMYLASNLGVGLIRMEWNWPILEKNAPVGGVHTYDFSRTDYIVNAANKYGIQLQIIFWGTPCWASSSPGSCSVSSSTSNYPAYTTVHETNTSDWSSFINAYVSRYKNSVHYWEMWNEPNGSGYWTDSGGGPAGTPNYVNFILKPGYTAVKNADSTAFVTLGPDNGQAAGSGGYPGQQFYQDVINNGGGNSFDIASFHDYGNTAQQGVNNIKAVVGSKPIWIGEVGQRQWSNDNGGYCSWLNSTTIDNHTKADDCHSTLLKTLFGVTGAAQITWYDLRDDLPRKWNNATNTFSMNENPAWGFVQHDDNTINNSYCFFQNYIYNGTIGNPLSNPITCTNPPLPSGVPPSGTPTPTTIATSTPVPTIAPPTPTTGPATSTPVPPSSTPSPSCANILPSGAGTDTLTFTANGTGLHTIWSRLMSPDTTNHSYYLQVQGVNNNCPFKVMTNQTSWNWSNIDIGTGSPVSVNLTSGTSYTITLTGGDANTKLDELIVTQDASCVPTGNGDNCMSISPTPTVTPTPGSGGTGLHVSGNQILDANNNAIRLIGADHSGTEYACDQLSGGVYGWGLFDHDMTTAEIQTMRSWNMNVVRIPLNEDCWLAINNINPATSGTAYQNYIKGLVTTFNQQGIYVILDLHWSAPGTIVPLTQQSMPDVDHSPAFWTSVATTFKGNNNVIFDPFNEPFIYTSETQNPSQDVWACWLSGCGMNTVYDGGTAGFKYALNWQSAGMQQLVTAIRGTGATNLIMVGGLNWARDLSGWAAHKPTDSANNMAVAWHSYPSGNPSLVTECASQSVCWDPIVAPLALQYPIITGETGDSSAGPLTYINNFLPWADAHGISYVAWTWNAWGNPDDVLITNYNGTPTTGEGQYYHDHLATLPPVLLIPSGSTTVTPQPSSTGSPTATPKPPTATPIPTTGPTATPPPNGGTLYSDDFEADTVGAQATGWTMTGTNGNWSVQAGSGTDTTHVYQHPSGGWNSWVIPNTGSSWTDYTTTMSILPSAWASEDDGPMVRVQNTSNYYYVQLAGGTTLNLQKVVSGTATTLATTAWSHNATTWYNFKIAVIGSTITVYVNNQQLLTATDSSFGSGTIGFHSGSPYSFDNVLVTSALAPTSTPVPTIAPPTATPTPLPTATPTPKPTNTPTPLPTATPKPTSTPVPTIAPPTPTTASCTPNTGDLNGDGHIDLTDFSIFAKDYGKTTTQLFNPKSDLNCDGIVDLTDFSIFAAHYGT